MIKRARKQHSIQATGYHDQPTDNTEKTIYLSLPFAGKPGNHLSRRLKDLVQRNTLTNVRLNCVYKAKKLGSRFRIKDKQKQEHNHDLVYSATCPDEQCNKIYIGETARRLGERIMDHGGRDKKSNVYRHSQESKHGFVTSQNFEILSTSYPWRNKRKIAEAILIKERIPELNEQGQSISLKLLN